MISLLLILTYSTCVLGYGYDAGSDHAACGKNFRQSRAFQPPCNLAEENYCTQAGSRYPWHAVKRFVRENQGLMRRMYGDQRHSSVIKEEFDPDEFDLDQFNEINHRYRRFNNERPAKDDTFQGRFMQNDFDWNELYFVDGDEEEEDEEEEETQGRAFSSDDVRSGEMLNAKFVYSEEGEIVKAQVMEIKNIPMFRESSTSSSGSTEASTVAVSKTKASLSSSTTQTTKDVKVTTNKDAVNVTESNDQLQLETEVKITNGSSALPVENNNNTNGFDTSTESLNATKKLALKLADDDEQSSISTISPTPSTTTTTGEVLFQDLEEHSTKRAPQSNRINYEKLKGVNACPVKEEVVAPFWANNTRGEVLALLNLYPFEQYVHWEKCTYEHKQMYCREGCRCEQQYRLHRLLAYDPNNECRGIFSDWFKFPSCCVCKCYNIPTDFRVTSRSPRRKTKDLDIGKELPEWIKSRAKLQV
ncbi:protein spaetzle 4 isoform X2 [Agrilus planipennis]|uniref:Protein spaetzle 4 isoform X2 n=1 Tax=Agrilus planipennis TaxID=224129 RepID=A0A1W4WZI2_AGRPL|nr:protein spaetzle 4 isoform X2 [Agrilus planipennis]